MLKSTFAILMLGTVCIPGFAQEVKFSGVVRGADDDSPLIGATVKASSGAVVVTDADGAFSINVKKDHTVTFSYIGYLPQTVKVDNGTKGDIFLKEDSEALALFLWLNLHRSRHSARSVRI